jgi:hypothetical protein
MNLERDVAALLCLVAPLAGVVARFASVSHVPEYLARGAIPCQSVSQGLWREGSTRVGTYQ